MSTILWDSRAKKPQIWVIPFFIFLTIGLAFGLWSYGKSKADAKAVEQAQDQQDFK